MCDALALRYVEALNDNQSNLEPSVLLFSEPDCSGLMYPTSLEASPILAKKGDKVKHSKLGPNHDIKSLFVPFNVEEVTLESKDAKHKLVLRGPWIMHDYDDVAWPHEKGHWDGAIVKLSDDPIDEITVTKNPQPWDNHIMDMCMGSPKFMSQYMLSRYTPHTEACNAFMEGTWCKADGKHIHSDACACFEEIPKVQALGQSQSGDDGQSVSLPVACFGQRCATRNAYRTSNMLTVPCNITLCQQKIASIGDLNPDQTAEIFCGGQFYQTVDTIDPRDDISVASAMTDHTDTHDLGSSSQKVGFPVFIMLGVSGLIFFVLVYFMFKSPAGRHQQKIQAAMGGAPAAAPAPTAPAPSQNAQQAVQAPAVQAQPEVQTTTQPAPQNADTQGWGS